jgi:hypothetical protein
VSSARDTISGWPGNDEFRAWLGIDPSDVTDVDVTAAALDAGIVDAVAVGFDPVDPVLTARARTALFGISRLWLNARSQPETWVPGSPTALERAGFRRVLAADAGGTIGAT